MVEYSWDSRDYSHDTGPYRYLLKAGFEPIKPSYMGQSAFYKKGYYFAHVRGDSLGVVGPKHGLEEIMQEIDHVVKREDRNIARRARRRELKAQAEKAKAKKERPARMVLEN